MGDQRNGGISWTDQTWSPIRGCSRVSPGCQHCYAERMAARFCGPGMPYEGLALRHGKLGGRWTGEVRLIPEHLADPLRWKRPRRVFVNSMSDLFHEKLTNEAIASVFGVMAAAPRHTFQVLTKRADRMRSWMEWAGQNGEGRGIGGSRIAAPHGYAVVSPWPRPNVWLGVTVEDQERADERIPDLLATPAAVRFLSVEPMLSAVDLTAMCPPFYAPHLRSDRIGWVIVGAESGPGARECQLEWVRGLVEQCKAAGVACWVKQLQLGVRLVKDVAEFPADLRVRQMPGTTDTTATGAK